MNAEQSHVSTLLQRAQLGDVAATGELLDDVRPYLKVLALRFLDRRVRGRIDASDVVQQTCLSVHRNLAQFAGTNGVQFLAWLRRIHLRNLQNVYRDHVTSVRRSVEREGPPNDAALDSLWVENPSQRLMDDEESVRLAQAMEQLPDDQAKAVRLRYLEGYTIKDISARMERSDKAIMGLLWRGLKKLRLSLAATEGRPRA